MLPSCARIVFSTSPVEALMMRSIPSESLGMRSNVHSHHAIICLFKGVQMTDKIFVVVDTTDLMMSLGSPISSTPFEMS